MAVRSDGGPAGAGDREAGPPRGPASVDLAVAAVAVGVLLAVRLGAAGEEDALARTLAGAALAVASGALLAWRQAAPLPALASALVLGTAGAALGEPETGVALVSYALAYSAAVEAGDRVRRVAWAAGSGWAAQTAVTFVRGPSTETGSEALTAAVAFALALALGDNLRRRRREVAHLRERVAAGERERELQVRHAVTVERLRIAREVHDVVAHGVSLLVLQAEAGRRELRRRPDAGEEALERVGATAREAMAHLRAAVGVLREDGEGAPVRAPAQGLDALPDLVDAAGDRTTLVERGTRPAPAAPVGLAVYRVVQEALTNVRRHATGARVAVTLDWRRDEVVVEVRDDGGDGPAEAVAGSPGHGLAGMGERARLLGGRLEAGPRADGPGWRVMARLPTAGGTP